VADLHGMVFQEILGGVLNGKTVFGRSVFGGLGSIEKDMPPKKVGKSSYEEGLILYEKLVATNKKIERKGATMPYTSFNGHMFSFLSKEGTVALRLPDEVTEAFI